LHKFEQEGDMPPMWFLCQTTEDSKLVKLNTMSKAAIAALFPQRAKATAEKTEPVSEPGTEESAKK